MSSIVRASLAVRLKPEVLNAFAALAAIAVSRAPVEDIDPWGKLQAYSPLKSQAADRAQFSRNLRLANARAQSQLRARRSSR